MIKILQWTIHGYSNNYDELQLLTGDVKPSAFCLHETNEHTKPKSNRIQTSTRLKRLFL